MPIPLLIKNLENDFAEPRLDLTSKMSHILILNFNFLVYGSDTIFVAARIELWIYVLSLFLDHGVNF